MKRIFLSILTITLVFLAATAWGQATAQRIILDFVDGMDLEMTYEATRYSYATGGISEGDSIPANAIIRTGASTSAELRMQPSGSLIKLARNTVFQVSSIAANPSQTSSVSVVAGKIRAVAARGTNLDVHAGNTVAGIRGTDFSLAFEDEVKALLLVKEGIVEFSEMAADGSLVSGIMVSAGQYADYFSGFMALPFSEEILAQEYGDMEIDSSRLPVADDPGLSEDDAIEADIASDDELESIEPVTIADTALVADEPDDQPPATAPESPFVKWLRDNLGMEIGSITIDGVTWAKAIIQPEISIGKLRAGLYLPIIYSRDLFDPKDWYHPNGNDEWSFGFDIGWQDRPLEAVLDLVSDLALKFRYFEYGEPLKDSFFIKAGNLSSFTVGHGLIMRNYANDTEFPAVRRLGINLGIDFGTAGFEAIVNDLANPEIFGGRFYLRPIQNWNMAFGISAISDFAPASIFINDDNPDGAEKLGNPSLNAIAFDIDLPIISTDLFSIRSYADIAAMLPIVRSAGDDGLETGPRWDAIWQDNMIQNWGSIAGLMGNVAFIDWRLEYRYFTGAFRPAFFDSSYERMRSQYLSDWLSILSGDYEPDQAPSVMGIYGEGGFNIFNRKLVLELGYFWPWSADAKSISDQIANSNDYFKASLVVKKGLVPILDISGSISYERRNFVRSILGETENGVHLFDENTVFSGELVVPIPGAPNLDLALLVNTVLMRNPDGSIVFMDDNPTRPRIVPAISLETRLHF